MKAEPPVDFDANFDPNATNLSRLPIKPRRDATRRDETREGMKETVWDMENLFDTFLSFSSCIQTLSHFQSFSSSSLSVSLFLG